MKVHEGAHLAVGLVRDARPRIIKAVVIPPGSRHQGNAALQGQACRPDLFRALAEGIEDAHPADGYPVAIVSRAGSAARSPPNPGSCGRPREGLMEQELAFGQLAVKGLQLLDFTD